mgnify:CR=1 FL=1
MTGHHALDTEFALGGSEQGLLILVVGPSGVGKDTLLDAARARLHDDETILFPRRCITRPAGCAGEIHIPIRAEDFSSMAKQGAFLLSWRAHNLCYGIPGHVRRGVANGKTVVVNASRSVIDDARDLLGNRHLRIISIRANKDALRKRLEARGREDAKDIEQRLKRASAYHITGPNVMHVDNDKDLETGIKHFIDAIQYRPIPADQSATDTAT